MTLEEMKQKVYSLIEEYNEDADELTEDEDLAGKMNSVINQIQTELARYKKIPASTTLEVTKDEVKKMKEIDLDFYQLDKVKGIDIDVDLDEITFKEDGVAKVYYYKFPKQITADTEDSYEFELSTDLLEIMPYGVAGDLLKSDVSSQYGAVYSARYREMIQQLDPRYGTGSAYIDGGIA